MASKKGKQHPSSSGKSATGARSHGKAGGTTAMRDEHFNLISVLYHALKGASACTQYIRDAEEAGDTELSQFFQEYLEASDVHAQRAKQLLADRVEDIGMEDEGMEAEADEAESEEDRV